MNIWAPFPWVPLSIVEYDNGPVRGKPCKFWGIIVHHVGGFVVFNKPRFAFQWLGYNGYLWIPEDK